MDPTKDADYDNIYYIYLIIFLILCVGMYFAFTQIVYKSNKAEEDEFLTRWSESHNISLNKFTSGRFTIEMPENTDIDILKLSIKKILSSKAGKLKIKSHKANVYDKNREVIGVEKFTNYISGKVEYEEYSTLNTIAYYVTVISIENKINVESHCEVNSYWDRWNKPQTHDGALAFLNWKEGWYSNSGQSVYKSYLFNESLKNHLKQKGLITENRGSNQGGSH